MQLKEFSLENYKTFKQEEFSFTEISVLIGKNNSGKSNLIQALEDFKNSIRGKPYRDSEWCERRVSNGDKFKDIKLTVTFEMKDEEIEKILDELLENNNIGDATYNKIKKTDSLRKYESQLTINVLDNRIRRKLFTWVDEEKVYVNNPNSSIGKYMSLNDSSKLDIVEHRLKGEINNILKSQLNQWEFVSAFREPKDAMTVQFDSNLKEDGDNLVRVLETLRKERESVFNKIRDSYVEIIENVSDLKVGYDREHSGTGYNTLKIKEGNLDFKFKSEDISAGSKEILVLLTQMYLAEEDNGLLVVEEPELHLHPKAESLIYEKINNIAESGVQILVATHSNVFVDNVNSNSVIKVERSDKSVLRSIKPAEIEKELKELGYDKSGFLQSEAVVLVEGKSDKLILEEISKTLGFNMEGRGISIVELEGEGNMKKDARSIVKLLDSFNINYRFLLDSDGRNKDELVGEYLDTVNRNETDTWWKSKPKNFLVWSEYSIESYLINATRSLSELLEVKEDEINEFVNSKEHEDDSKTLNGLFKEHFGEEYRKDAHGMMIARKMNKDEIPKEFEEKINDIRKMV